MNRPNTSPLPVVAALAVADTAPRDEVPEQASFPWFSSAMLACESFEVIRLRLEKFLIGGDDAGHEARLMVKRSMRCSKPVRV